jgi:hypothetical protein
MAVARILRPELGHLQQNATPFGKQPRFTPSTIVANNAAIEAEGMK